MTLSLFIQAKAMMLALRSEKSSRAIQSLLKKQTWLVTVRLRMARVRQITEGIGAEPSFIELLQLETLVRQWERGR
jgi:hypothetical protein